MKLVYSILLSKEINKDEFVSFVKDTELLFVPRLSTRVSFRVCRENVSVRNFVYCAGYG